MRTTIRRLVLALVFGTISAPALTAAPFPPGPTEAELMGTWSGTIAPEGSGQLLDGGIISIGRDVTGIVVTVGPSARVRYPTKRIERTERGLKFEVYLPGAGEETRLLVYELNVEGSSMTGNVIFVRHGLTAPASIAFVKQGPA